MYSLLTKEINNYNLGKNKETNNNERIYIIYNEIEKKIVNSEYNHYETPIPIKKIEKSENSLNIHIFNPLKNSPPSNWQFRLLNRINSLNDLQNIKSLNDLENVNSLNDLENINN